MSRFHSSDHYDGSFYYHQKTGSQTAAAAILPLIFDDLRPKSVVDLGCGVGTWLTEALRLGASCAVGIEGPWVAAEDLVDDRIKLVSQDLVEPIAISGGYDLAISLEVAEHLPSERAVSLIEDLCGLSDWILFSAAVPGQGGVNHVNEQWQSYWIELFAACGYVSLDVIRHRVWHNSRIPGHYRQNMFLFYRKTGASDDATFDILVKKTAPWPANLIHPDMHENVLASISAPPTLPEALGVAVRLPIYAYRSVRARLWGEV